MHALVPHSDPRLNTKIATAHRLKNLKTNLPLLGRVV